MRPSAPLKVSPQDVCPQVCWEYVYPANPITPRRLCCVGIFPPCNEARSGVLARRRSCCGAVGKRASGAIVRLNTAAVLADKASGDLGLASIRAEARQRRALGKQSESARGKPEPANPGEPSVGLSLVLVPAP